MATHKTLLAEAMHLPASDRLRLAHDLLGSVDDAVDEDAAEAWASEIGRRAREVEDGTAELIDANEVHRQVRENLRARRAARE